MEMYVSDNNKYPPALGGPPFRPWANRLIPYDPVDPTNASWNCPTYLANKGIVEWQPPPPGGGSFVAWTSYSYNAFGMTGFTKVIGSHLVGGGRNSWLGLGNLNLTVPEQQIVSPSEMYAVADARPFTHQGLAGYVGNEEMNSWVLGVPFVATFTEASPPHSQGYNLLFNDAHVALVKRNDYLYPPRSAHNWNRDNQPHPERWSPRSQWAIQKLTQPLHPAFRPTSPYPPASLRCQEFAPQWPVNSPAFSLARDNCGRSNNRSLRRPWDCDIPRRSLSTAATHLKSRCW